ncbi:hypothetical protein F5876DRAFT_65646 [Lentinula aff. lateritia]|uniref:Uncharacterized protein n=1 Tax=Lentinula aff. lateritia TaxID=2804960 RepID=A0ACC1U109_9AGAR|nr:hypothetical protein F5876DRAFT_65646 [Lentinula aff. lateritia]
MPCSNSRSPSIPTSIMDHAPDLLPLEDRALKGMWARLGHQSHHHNHLQRYLRTFASQSFLSLSSNDENTPNVSYNTTRRASNKRSHNDINQNQNRSRLDVGHFSQFDGSPELRIICMGFVGGDGERLNPNSTSVSLLFHTASLRNPITLRRPQHPRIPDLTAGYSLPIFISYHHPFPTIPSPRRISRIITDQSMKPKSLTANEELDSRVAGRSWFEHLGVRESEAQNLELLIKSGEVPSVISSCWLEIWYGLVCTERGAMQIYWGRTRRRVMSSSMPVSWDLNLVIRIGGDSESKFTSVLGHIDILVNSAATVDRPVPISASNSGDWSFALDTNVNGTYRLIKAPLLLQNQDSNAPTQMIINLVSAIIHIPTLQSSAYTIGKSALFRMAEMF